VSDVPAIEVKAEFVYPLSFIGFVRLPPGVKALNFRAEPNGAILGQLHDTDMLVILPNLPPTKVIAGFKWWMVYAKNQWGYIALIEDLLIDCTSSAQVNPPPLRPAIDAALLGVLRYLPDGVTPPTSP
jgi:hypothetical protein